MGHIDVEQSKLIEVVGKEPLQHKRVKQVTCKMKGHGKGKE